MPSFNQFYEGLADAQFDWVADTIKIALLTSSWTPNRANDFYSELTNELAAGDGYTAGGVTLAGKALLSPDGSQRIGLDCNDPAWTFAATKAFRYAIIYKDTGVAGTSRLMWYVDLGSVSVSGTYTLVVNAAGIIRFGDV